MATAKTIATTNAKNAMSEKRQQMNTPVGVAVYPRLNEPDYKFQPAGEFSVNVRLTEKDARPLITALDEMLDKWHTEESMTRRKPNLKKAPLPVKPAVDDDGNETDEWDFKFKMKHNVVTQSGKSWTQRPKLYDSQLRGFEGTGIGGGSELVVNFVPSTYYTPALGCGVTFRLNAVQVIKLKEYVSKNRPEDMGFSATKGGYVAEEDSLVDNTKKEGATEAPKSLAEATSADEL